MFLRVLVLCQKEQPIQVIETYRQSLHVEASDIFSKKYWMLLVRPFVLKLSDTSGSGVVGFAVFDDCPRCVCA